MEMIREYIVLIGGFLIFQALLEGLLPAHTSRKYIRLVLGAVFLLVMLQPLQNIFQWEPSFTLLTEGEESIGYESRVQQMTSEQYEIFLKEKGLPEEWKEKWQIRKIEVRCSQGIPEQIDIQVSEKQEGRQIDPIHIQLGTLGQKKEEKEEEKQLLQELASYWGVDMSRIQVEIEGK